MANELVHASQGTELFQAEYESVTAHILNSQATGDTIYASSASQLSRLAIGATDTLLSVVGGIPAWVSEINNITLDTAVAKGTWTAAGTWTLPPLTVGGAVDVLSGHIPGILLGADNGAITRTNNTQKIARIGAYHYTNAEESITLINLDSNSTYTEMNIGGGSGAQNAATIISFWTAPAIATITGTERMRIDSAGNVGIGVPAPTGVLHLKAGIATAGFAPLKLTAGTNLTTPEAGAVEWNGTNLFITQTDGTRKTLAYV